MPVAQIVVRTSSPCNHQGVADPGGRVANVRGAWITIIDDWTSATNADSGDIAALVAVANVAVGAGCPCSYRGVSNAA